MIARILGGLALATAAGTTAVVTLVPRVVVEVTPVAAVGDTVPVRAIAYNAANRREPCRESTPHNCLSWRLSDTTRAKLVPPDAALNADADGYTLTRLVVLDTGLVTVTAVRTMSDGEERTGSADVVGTGPPVVQLELEIANDDTADAFEVVVGDSGILAVPFVARAPGLVPVPIAGRHMWVRVRDSLRSGGVDSVESPGAPADTAAPPDTASPAPPAAAVLVSLHVSPSTFALAPAARRSVNVWGRIRVAPDSAIRVATEAELHALAGPFTFTSSDSTVAAAWSQGAGSLWGTVEALRAGTARVTACAAAASPAAGLCGYPGTVTVAP